MYMHLFGCEQLRSHPGCRYSKYRLFHILPARIPKFFPQPPLCPFPILLSHCYLPLASSRQAKQALPSVLSAPGANPALFPQQTHCSRQSRTVHRKTSTQTLLIHLSRCGQCGKQTELRDLKTCLSQFLVVNPRYDPAEAAKVLTRTRQGKKRLSGLLSIGWDTHIICIYICRARASNQIVPS